jgi:large subunit ribosomal protein L10
MNKEEKQEVIETLKNKFSQYSNFYITDTESLSVSQINDLRRHCYDKQVEMRVAKNTLIKKALEGLDSEKYSGVYDSLHKVTALMFSESPKDPAVIISSFRKSQNGEKPQLKAAFLNGDIFVGDNQLINLTKIKTKNELIGEVIGLLMSPVQRVIGALQNRPETTEEKTPEAAESKTEAATEVKVEPAKTEESAKPVEAKAPKAEAAPEAKAENAETPKGEAKPEDSKSGSEESKTQPEA